MRSVFVKSLDVATASLRDIGPAMGRSERLLHAIRAGERRVTKDAASKLATYLRGRAREFEEAADELERAIREEAGRDG